MAARMDPNNNSPVILPSSTSMPSTLLNATYSTMIANASMSVAANHTLTNANSPLLEEPPVEGWEGKKKPQAFLPYFYSLVLWFASLLSQVSHIVVIPNEQHSKCSNSSVGEDDPQARNVLAELESYAKFSFVVNGLVTWLVILKKFTLKQSLPIQPASHLWPAWECTVCGPTAWQIQSLLAPIGQPFDGALCMGHCTAVLLP